MTNLTLDNLIMDLSNLKKLNQKAEVSVTVMKEHGWSVYPITEVTLGLVDGKVTVGLMIENYYP